MSGWIFAELRAEDGVFAIRRRALPDPADRALYPVAIWITWPREPDDTDEDATVAAMMAFEDALHVAADAGRWGLLIAVVTTGAAREWLWYAADATEFVGELRGALTGHPAYPFEVRAWADPNWRAARELSPRETLH